MTNECSQVIESKIKIVIEFKHKRGALLPYSRVKCREMNYMYYLTILDKQSELTRVTSMSYRSFFYQLTDKQDK